MKRPKPPSVMLDFPMPKSRRDLAGVQGAGTKDNERSRA
jgi:hypothetical protein